MFRKKKMLSVALMFFFLFTMFFTGIQETSFDRENETVFSFSGVLYLECHRALHESTGFEQETDRQMLQSQRRILQRIPSLRISTYDFGNAMQNKVNAPRILGVLSTMVFLTVIIYIYRTDGKKRYCKLMNQAI